MSSEIRPSRRITIRPLSLSLTCLTRPGGCPAGWCPQRADPADGSPSDCVASWPSSGPAAAPYPAAASPNPRTTRSHRLVQLPLHVPQLLLLILDQQTGSSSGPAAVPCHAAASPNPRTTGGYRLVQLPFHVPQLLLQIIEQGVLTHIQPQQKVLKIFNSLKIKEGKTTTP